VREPLRVIHHILHILAEKAERVAEKLRVVLEELRSGGQLALLRVTVRVFRNRKERRINQTTVLNTQKKQRPINVIKGVILETHTVKPFREASATRVGPIVETRALDNRSNAHG